MVKRLVLLLCLVIGSALALHAQARPTASRGGDLQAGGGFISANANTLYDSGRFNGGFAYVDLDLLHHLGVEFELNQLYSPSDDQVRERTYNLGVRYFRNYGRFAPYGKIMAGRGVFNYPFDEANLAYNLFVGGAGIDYRLKRYLNLRAEFEYQHWNSFPLGDLNPTLVKIGAAYHFK